MTVFSNMHEGTYLRRNLFISFGLCNCGLAYLFNKHNPFLKVSAAATLPFSLIHILTPSLPLPASLGPLLSSPFALL